MASYILLGNWTDQGVRNVTESRSRGQAFQEMATAMGCTVQGIFWTMGRYDVVARVEAPDDVTMSALALKLASSGNVRSETMRAYTSDEFASIIEKMSG